MIIAHLYLRLVTQSALYAPARFRFRMLLSFQGGIGAKFDAHGPGTRILRPRLGAVLDEHASLLVIVIRLRSGGKRK